MQRLWFPYKWVVRTAMGNFIYPTLNLSNYNIMNVNIDANTNFYQYSEYSQIIRSKVISLDENWIVNILGYNCVTLYISK